MSRPPRRERTYSPEEKQKALLQLAMNGGNLQRTSQVTGIPDATLSRWREEGFAEFALARAKIIDEFMDTLMKNIRELNKPKYIKKLKEKSLEEGFKGALREIAQYTAIIMDRMIVWKRSQFLEGSPAGLGPKPTKELSDEELDKKIQEEKAKQKKRKKEE